MGKVKGGRPEALRGIATLCEQHADSTFLRFFDPEGTLIPVPPSSPARTADTLWPGLGIAESLLAQGLGGQVSKLLARSTPVAKAHEQPADNRPKFEELVDSLEWRGDLGIDIARVILVDDVVTRGTTFLSAREAITRIQPSLDVVGFAAIRTMSFEPVTHPLDPVTGTISLGANGWGVRNP